MQIMVYNKHVLEYFVKEEQDGEFKLKYMGLYATS